MSQLGIFFLLTQFTPKRQQSKTWNLGSILPYTTLWKQRICLCKRETITIKIAILLEYLVARKKIEFSLISDDSGLVIFKTDSRNIFGGNVGDDKGILMRGKGPHESTQRLRTILFVFIR